MHSNYRRPCHAAPRLSAVFLLLVSSVAAQQPATLDQVMERLNRLERENEDLRQQVRELRGDLDALRGAPAQPEVTVERLDERLQVAEHRVDEQAQTKVESSQKFPIRITGMVLVNGFHNGEHAGGQDNPVTASRVVGKDTAGMTFRQTILGLEYRGPLTLWGGHVRGAMAMDFYDGSTETNAYAPMRLRTASVGIDWATRSLTLAQEKPLVALRDPTSLSYQGISPLTGAGNLWRWQQQVRFEQRIGKGSTTLDAQAAVVETSEDAGVSAAVLATGDRRRPGLQGRFLITHRLDGEKRIEFAPAFHLSSSHFSGQKITSSLFAMDWFAKPIRLVEFSGTFFSGQNISHFGATRQSIVVTPAGTLIPVHARGGWGQITIPFTARASWNLLTGIHDDRNRDLVTGNTASNHVFGSNVMYRFAPNVMGSFEFLQIRTTYLGVGSFINNRYDLAVAYLF